jgi:hypothetical protein
MAGDWIKMRKTLPTDPRIVRIMSALKADRFRTLGGVLSAWCLFDDQTEDGQLDGYTPEVFDEVVGFPGLARAMEAVGWLEIGPDFIKAPRFYEHNGQSAKRRAQEAVRKMSARHADKTRTECGPEKRREEKSINSLSTVRDQSKHWQDSEDFRTAWMAWLSHLGAIRGPVSEPAEQQQLYELSRFSVDDATAIVRFSLGKQARNLITNGDHSRQLDANDAKQPTGRRKVPTLEEGVI